MNLIYSQLNISLFGYQTYHSYSQIPSAAAHFYLIVVCIRNENISYQKFLLNHIKGYQTKSTID